MPALVIGVLLLVAFVLLSRWFVLASPGAVLRTAKWAGVAVLLSAGLLLALTGRLGWALAALAGAAPWVMRALQTRAVYRSLRGAWSRMRGGAPSAGTTSQVETSFVRMSLDHDSGEMDGVVLQGPLEGCRLRDLTEEEFHDLWRLCEGDQQSRQLLSAWAERVHPEWGGNAEASRERGGTSAAGGMSRDEAYEILGLAPGASAEAIRKAHRRLMTAVHPDHGGSTYLAARINQAKDVLLGS